MAADGMLEKLFPLPFTPFELYYWCDDRSDYPTTFPMELTFRGTLCRGVFEEAVEVTLSRHPMLRALVDADAGRLPVWIFDEATHPQTDWGDASKPVDHLAGRFIDLTSSPGLRLWVRTSSERSRVILQFHHACCDALGATRFVEDLLVAYAALTDGDDPRAGLQPLDFQRLRQRGDFGLTEANYRPTLRDAYRTARYWTQKLVQRPALVAIPPDVDRSQAADKGDLGYLTAFLTKDDGARLRQQAARRKATVNDLMLRDLFLTLRDWNTSYEQSKRRLVVNVPVSLRTRYDRNMPAANVLGYWFVDRKVDACDDAGQLLEGIHREMEAVKRWRLPLYFIGGLGYASRFPRLIRRVLRTNRSFATIVHSNAGRVLARTPLPREDRKLVCGDVVLEKVTAAPPIRPGTRAAIGVAIYGRDTCINLRWDPQVLGAVEAQRLLDAYVEMLMRSAGSAQSD